LVEVQRKTIELHDHELRLKRLEGEARQ
jgi:hypothetical protein